jgi:hypothetical protein
MACALPTLPALAGGPVEAASCPPLGSGNYVFTGDSRIAQTFTPGITGKLTSAQINVTKNMADGPGDYKLSVATVDGVGVPTNQVLATTAITPPPGGSINVPIIGAFASPAGVTAGTPYALVVSRPGAGANGLRLQGRASGCPGSMFKSINQTDPYTDNGSDLVFTALVDTAPLAAIKKHPKRKTASEKARIKFFSDEADATFQCKLDKRKFKPRKSPVIYRGLDPGKHRFRVQALDAAGNVSPPANFRWTVL